MLTVGEGCAWREGAGGIWDLCAFLCDPKTALKKSIKNTYIFADTRYHIWPPQAFLVLLCLECYHLKGPRGCEKGK